MLYRKSKLDFYKKQIRWEMGTQQFLKLVLPDTGNKIIAIATPNEKGNVWFKYKK